MMNALFNLPMGVRVAAVFILGCAVGGIVNWAIYALAWNRRAISPWSAPPVGVSPRGWLDRVPLLGWLRLRREAPVHGRGFWIRPLVVELMLATGLAALYGWEVGRQGLYSEQLTALFQNRAAAAGTVVPAWLLHLQFTVHGVLIAFMVAASLIDIDEKLIPDAVTVVGTLIGLLLAAAVPMMLLPQVSVIPVGRPVGRAETLSVPMERPAGRPMVIRGNQVVAQGVTLTAPNRWPDVLEGSPNWRSLVLGIACYWLWCFALVERIWRGRRGFWFGLRLITARIVRDLRRPLMFGLLTVGTLVIAGLWQLGGDRWAGLLTALVGLVVGGGIVWAVRIVGSAALKREAMGFGDVTLMMMVGTFLGWQACLILFFIAPFAGLVVGLLQWLLRSDDVIPYGPFLCMAAGYVLVTWASIWNWGHRIFEIGGLVPITLAVCLVAMGLMLTLWQAFKENVLGLKDEG